METVNRGVAMKDSYVLTRNHPMVKNHMAYGRELFPGLAYIDLIYQFFRERGYEYTMLELRHLSIYSPMLVENDTELVLTLLCEEQEEGNWNIKLEGYEGRGDSPDPKPALYATAEMWKRAPVSFTERLDLHKIRNQSPRRRPLEDFYAECRKRELSHTGIMKAEGTVYAGKDATIVEIAIDNRTSNADDYMFHPALIDGSGVGAGVLFDSENWEDQRLFLPIHYESFIASELLGTECLTRVRKDGQVRKKELHYITLEFFNHRGQKIAQLTNYAGKLVREKELLDPGRDAQRKVEKREVIRHGRESVEHTKPGWQETKANRENRKANGKAELLLKGILSKKLGRPVDQLPMDVGYYELGLMSSSLLEMVSELERKLSVKMSPTLLFEYTNISELAEYLSGEYPEQFGVSNQEAHRPEISVPASNKGTARKESTAENRKLQNVYAKDRSPNTMDIAVVGMAGRYPQARDLNQFWDNLLLGRNCISEVPPERWRWSSLEGIYSPSGKPMSKWGGFISDVDCFDPKFFRISPREAETIDPQERLFLETCWETIEDAGYTPKTLIPQRGKNKRRPVGVFAGVMHKDYTILQAEAVARGNASPLSLNYASIANRVSYCFNFHGPSLTVDTVCSSSLVAVHLAVESIRRGESEIAIAGGVNLSLHPNKYLTYGLMDMHASDGLCHTFGKDGDGYVSGEGIGAVLLKPLESAIHDNDRIYAVIKGSVINHVGAVSGITVPSPVAQADMIEECLEQAGIDPRTISYVEAHGTGTSLGDPIEIQGLTKAFHSYTKDKQFCAIGSVKSNIGHAESSAGISGLHKLVLQMHHKTLVPSLHSEETNPYIDFASTPFLVQQSTEPWKRPEIEEEGEKVAYPRRAALSSFGAYGTNAHLILEEYIPDGVDIPCQQTGPFVIPLSARTQERLLAYARKLHGFLVGQAKERNDGEETKSSHMHSLCQKIKRLLAEEISVQEDAIDSGMEWSEFGIGLIELHRLRVRIQDVLGLILKTEELVTAGSIAGVATVLWNEHSQTIAQSDVPSSEHEEMGKETTGIRMEELAYTLQVGREAMEERIVFLANDVDDLCAQLHKFITQESTETDALTQGRVAQYKQVTSLLENDEDVQELLGKWIANGKWSKLSSLWVKGLDVDWSLLYNGVFPRRVSLPTYPFAKERYWVRGSLKEQPPEPSVKPEENLVIDPVSATDSQEDIGVVALSSHADDQRQSTAKKPWGIVLANLAEMQPAGPPSTADRENVDITKVEGTPMKLTVLESVSSLDNGETVRIDSIMPEMNQRSEPIPSKEHPRLERRDLRQQLKITLANALYMPPDDIDTTKKFVDLGLDSIVGVEWISVLNNKFGIPILATKVYDYPTLDEFADYLLGELNQQTSNTEPDSYSMEDILQRVHDGDMNIEQANALLQGMN